MDIQFIGAEKASFYFAELSGITWALLWVLQTGLSRPVYIQVDNKAAVMRTTNLWGGASEPMLTTVCSFLAGVVQARSPLEVTHIHRHCGHPWNEYADVIADRHCALQTPSFTVPFCASNILPVSEHRLDWVIMLLSGSLRTSAFPPIVD